MPAVSKLAGMFEERVNRRRFDLEDFLDLGFDGLVKEEYTGDEVFDEGCLELKSEIFVQ